MKDKRLQALEENARAVGRTIKQSLPKDMRFLLVLTTPGKGGFMTWISDIERNSAREMMRELEAKMAADSVGGDA